MSFLVHLCAYLVHIIQIFRKICKFIKSLGSLTTEGKIPREFFYMIVHNKRITSSALINYPNKDIKVNATGRVE